MKRILTVQDISCLGKCSLTVALPLISAMGVETAILPTALLSTHTMFKDFTFKDLSSQIKPITDHWKKEGIVKVLYLMLYIPVILEQLIRLSWLRIFLKILRREIILSLLIL